MQQSTANKVSMGCMQIAEVTHTELCLEIYRCNVPFHC